jgi:iron complex transport system permease protein
MTREESIRTLTPSRFWSWMALFGGFAIVCAAVGPMFGTQPIDFARALDFSIPLSENTDRFILFGTRVPRVVLALVTGASLAMSGAAMQALLRNPLASPFTLGVASGGTFGAALVIFLGAGGTALMVPGTVLGAFILSMATIALVWGLAYRRGRLPTGMLLLAGVSVNFLFGALVLLLQYMSDFEQNFALIRWMMGSLDTVGYQSVWGVLPVLVVAAVVLFRYSRSFNLMALGDEAAKSSGVDVRGLELAGFLASGLLAGAAVSQVGPIGFVGLMVPHAVRMLVGPDYRLVIPGSLLAGAGFLVLCDLVSRIAISPYELPPGIITAILGAPFFLWLLKRRGREIVV